MEAEKSTIPNKIQCDENSSRINSISILNKTKNYGLFFDKFRPFKKINV